MTKNNHQFDVAHRGWKWSKSEKCFIEVNIKQVLKVLSPLCIYFYRRFFNIFAIFFILTFWKTNFHFLAIFYRSVQWRNKSKSFAAKKLHPSNWWSFLVPNLHNFHQITSLDTNCENFQTLAKFHLKFVHTGEEAEFAPSSLKWLKWLVKS